MAVNIKKGGSVNLDKFDLNSIGVGLGWGASETSGVTHDLDLSAFCLNQSNNCVNDNEFVFYNNTQNPSKSVLHYGDDRSGGDGNSDNEEMEIKLNDVPEVVKSIAIIATIHDPYDKGHKFKDVSNSYVRIWNRENGKEIARYELEKDFKEDNGVFFAKFVRKDKGWIFEAVGTGTDNKGLAGFVELFGLQVA